VRKKKKTKELNIEFITKEDRLIINLVNQQLGTSYRTLPYDLKKNEDWQELLVDKTAEFMDFFFYGLELDSLLENLDESIEVFQPVQWAMMTMPKTSSSPVHKLYGLLRKTTEHFQDYASQLEEQVKQLWIFAYQNAPEEVLTMFDIPRLNKEEAERLLDDRFTLFILHNQTDRPYSVDELAGLYISSMGLRWKKIVEGTDDDY